MKTLQASAFKARCLALLDDVARTGETITITKRGRPLAQLGPVTRRGRGFPQDALKGAGRIVGDVVAPALPPESWDANRGRLRGDED
jgi:prevent-host-death family protein